MSAVDITYTSANSEIQHIVFGFRKRVACSPPNEWCMVSGGCRAVERFWLLLPENYVASGRVGELKRASSPNRCWQVVWTLHKLVGAYMGQNVEAKGSKLRVLESSHRTARKTQVGLVRAGKSRYAVRY